MGVALKVVDTGNKRVEQICDILKKEIVDVAHKEAQGIVEQAQKQAQAILQAAQAEVAQLQKNAEEERQKARGVFLASLHQAGKQVLASLQDKLENSFFSQELMKISTEALQDPTLLAKLVEALIEAIQKQGLDVDLAVLIGKKVNKEAVQSLLASKILEKVEGKTLQIGEKQSGCVVKMKQQHMSIEMTEETLQEALSDYLKEDVRKMLFQGS